MAVLEAVMPKVFRTAVGRGCRKDPLPLGTVVVRQLRRNARKCFSRYIKVHESGVKSRRWMLYSRFWWEKNRGAVPHGKMVVHVDGDSMNDDPGNLALGTTGINLVLLHNRDLEWSRRQHKRASKGAGEYNRQKGMINRAKNFLKNYWYPVVDEMTVVLNVPFRRRKHVLASLGVDVSRFPSNGCGKKPSSEAQKALKSCAVRLVRSQDLSNRQYASYCLLDPVSMKVRGPMSGSLKQLVDQLERMGVWAFAEKYAKKDLRERK